MCIIKWNHHLSAKRHRDSFEDVDLVHSVKVVARSPLRITTLITTVAKYLFWRKSIKNGNFDFEETHLPPRYSLDNRGKPVGDVEKTFHRPRHLRKDSKTPAQVHMNTFSKKTGNLHLDSCSRFFLKRRKTDNFVIFWKTLSKFDTKAGILVPPSKRSPWPPLRGLLEPPPDPGLWNIQSF